MARSATGDRRMSDLQHGRYVYRRITAMLRQAGWIVNVKRKRVERTWRGGLKVPRQHAPKLLTDHSTGAGQMTNCPRETTTPLVHLY